MTFQEHLEMAEAEGYKRGIEQGISQGILREQARTEKERQLRVQAESVNLRLIKQLSRLGVQPDTAPTENSD